MNDRQKIEELARRIALLEANLTLHINDTDTAHKT